MKSTFEISQALAPDGRRRVKFALHEIYPDETHCNANGITYLEEYSRKNADSIIGMPFCARFLDDDKEIPYDHGLTGEIGSMPVFEDSVQVGSADGWDIEEVEVDGEKRKAMVALGYINQQRYPKFVEWLEERQDAGLTTYGSVEFVGTQENQRIIYKDGKGGDDKYRVPIEYVYSGYCVLTVKPSDPAAMMLELNQAKNEEDNLMDNREIKELFETLLSRLDETNACKDTIASNEAEMGVKDNKIQELEDARASILEERDTLDKQYQALNQKYEDLMRQYELVQKDLAEMRVKERVGELNAALEPYSTKEREAAKDEIVAFEKDPEGCGIEINQITEKIEAAAYRQMKASMAAELNSAARVDDIFGPVSYTVVVNDGFCDMFD